MISVFSTDRTGMSKVHYIKFRTLNSLAPPNTRCHCAIYVRWLFGWRYISSLNSADEPQEGRNSCPTFADQIPCRSYVSSVYRMRSLAVCHSLTCSRFCGRVIIILNHHIAIKPVTPKTVAKNCLAPGNKEKETLGRPPFDIPVAMDIGSGRDTPEVH